MIFLIWVVTLAPLPWPVTPVMGATFTVNTTADTTDADTTDGNCADSSGKCSLRAAIQEANAQAGANTIVLQSGQTYTLSLDSGGDEDSAAEDDLDIVAGSTITIVGNGATITRSGECIRDAFSQAGEFRIFEVLSGGNLTLQNVTVRNGCADGSFPDSYGGGIRNVGTVTIQNSTISGNRAGGDGGGIYNDGGEVTLTNSTISGNSANGSGGGIRNDDTVTIINSTISGNSAGEDGGGIFNNDGGEVTLTNSTISNNSAEGWGGGIDNDESQVTIQSSTISGNSAGEDGGGIFNDDGTVTIQSSTISMNSADRDGGGIYNLFSSFRTPTITLTNSTISDNSADDGGGIYNDQGTVTITNSTISGNSAGEDGGGILNDEDGTVDASFVTIANNSASGQGGGIFNSAVDSTVNIKNSIVGNNTAGTGPNCSGGVTASGTNLATDGSCGMGFATVPSTGAGGLNLGPLQVNAPGTTATHALLAGSAAVDFAADCTFLNPPGGDAGTDQRGVPRPQRSLCDAGAYEVQNPRTLSVTISGNGTVTSNPGWINCSTGNTGTCTETYEQNTIVQLTATPGSGSVFTGWSGNSDCSDAQVAMNTDKACTATFVQQGTIVIQKTAIGGDGTFNFSRSFGANFSIMTTGGSGSQSFPLAPGTYTVTENTPPTGWAFQNLTCNDPSGGTTVNVNTRTATIDLDAGETVTCTFTNTRLGVSLLTLQQGTKCLTLDLLAGSYVFRTDLGTFSGAIQFTQTPSVIRFRSVRGARPALSGMINLGARAGSAMLAQGFHRWITLVDRNIDDNGPCPP